MNIVLAQFQSRAVNALLEYMDEPCRDIILKSPTGSGKTIILTRFMAEYIRGNDGVVFVWLTPGKGSLEEQSKAKMDKYVHGASTKLLDDVMTSGFSAGDCCFINWEKLNKKDNTALKEGERTDLTEWIRRAHAAGLKFKVIIDESHQNFTEKSDAVVKLFGADKIIRCSATPREDKRAKKVEVPEEEVIAEGLIKKMLVINGDFPQVVETHSQTEYLLDRALDKQRELRGLFVSRGKDINPLIIVQLPNNSDALADTVERFFFLHGITCGAGNLAVWLSNRHENISDISENNAKTTAVIIKQAVATGWDCPRAYILVKLRENMDETFEVQTVGRIRRMPEASHYGDDKLDSCYLYTFDGKFTQGVKSSLGSAALDAKTLFLKGAHKAFSLVKQQRTSVTDIRDSRKTLSAVAAYYKSAYSLTGDKKANAKKLVASGYIFSDGVVRHARTGTVAVLDGLQSESLNAIELTEPLNTHTHGREYLRRVGKLGQDMGMQYSYMNTVLARLFGDKPCSDKLLELSVRELYAFVINNFERLRQDFAAATADALKQIAFAPQSVSEKQFVFPRALTFTYDERAKAQTESRKNVYDGYLLSAEPRTAVQKKLERFCENDKTVDWVYKNVGGEAGFSLVYEGGGSQKLFYPDYILSVGGTVWIIAAADGDQARQKLEVLKRYAEKYEVKFGLVRYDNERESLCVCNDENDGWWLLADAFKER